MNYDFTLVKKNIQRLAFQREAIMNYGFFLKTNQ